MKMNAVVLNSPANTYIRRWISLFVTIKAF